MNLKTVLIRACWYILSLITVLGQDTEKAARDWALNNNKGFISPSITIKNKKSAPWFSTAIKKLISKRKRLFRKSKERNRPDTWQA